MSESNPPDRGVLTPRRPLVAVFVALIAGVLVALGASSDPDPPPAPAPTTALVVSKVDADADGKRDESIAVPEYQADQLVRGLEYRDAEITEPLREKDDPSLTPPGVLEGPLAADEFAGCRNRFVGNYSSRNGVSPRVIVLHQTVSPERGVASQKALTAMANRRSSGVSWHFLIGPTNGLCVYTVPVLMKAWTQANANPFSIGIEVERVGNERSYVEGAGERKLISVLRQLHDRFGIPLQRGRVVNCRVVRAGIVEHSELGACGGGHVDVTPWSTDPVIAKASAAEAKAARQRGDTCNKLRWHRAKFANQRPGKKGSEERKAWDARVARIHSLKARAKAQGLDEGKCRS